MSLRNTLAGLCLAGTMVTPAIAEDITFASWNIANLHHETGVALRDGSFAREDVDYERLAVIAVTLEADIIGLQEIGSPSALERIFPSSLYHLVVSDRYRDGDENRHADERDIFTAVAISKERFPSRPAIETISAFSIQHIDLNQSKDGPSIRPTRAAIHVEFELEGQPISFLNVHMKSSCHQFSLRDVEDQNFFNEKPFGSRFDCRTLKAQLAILENWVELQSALGKRVVIAGDFNLRLNAVYRNPTRYEDFWAELNDGQPGGLTLSKGPEGLDNVCWPKHEERFEEHIDLVIADAALLASFSNFRFDKIGLGFDEAPEYAEKAKQRLSDHCPVRLKLEN
jgi:endonuclease/exonuclease/phosphatase family metal-dependent hydrolase